MHFELLFVFVCVQFSNTMVFILLPPGLALYQDLHRVFALHQNTHHCLFCERILCALCVRVGCLHFACWKAPAMQTIFPLGPTSFSAVINSKGLLNIA